MDSSYAMAKLTTITDCIEEVAPLALQENYDNSGLIIGNKNSEVGGVLLCIDITEDVIDEAIQKNCNLIISHHPLIFSGIKKIIGADYVQRCIVKAIKNDIAIYAAHTNFDNAQGGVSDVIADKIGLIHKQILQPKSDFLIKLVTFVPTSHLNQVQEALFAAGAGHIGNYDQCSFNAEGFGTFRAGTNTNPFVGEINTFHKEFETRLEVVFPKHLQSSILKTL